MGLSREFIRVNGKLYNWGSLILKIDGVPFTGVGKIEYSQKRERVKGYGMAPHQGPRGRTNGKYTPDNVKMTLFEDTWKTLREMLALQSANGLSYGNPQVPIILQAFELELGVDQRTFDRCCIVSDGASLEEGSEPNMVDIEWDVMGIFENGMTLYDSTRGFV